MKWILYSLFIDFFLFFYHPCLWSTTHASHFLYRQCLQEFLVSFVRLQKVVEFPPQLVTQRQLYPNEGRLPIIWICSLQKAKWILYFWYLNKLFFGNLTYLIFCIFERQKNCWQLVHVLSRKYIACVIMSPQTLHFWDCDSGIVCYVLWLLLKNDWIKLP